LGQLGVRGRAKVALGQAGPMTGRCGTTFDGCKGHVPAKVTSGVAVNVAHALERSPPGRSADPLDSADGAAAANHRNIIAMRVLVFGNSGSGKSTYARALARKNSAPHLDLDSIVWEPGQVAVQRPTAAINASLHEFLAAHKAWVIEGCYGELVLAASAYCTELVFLNPGLEVCLANNRKRPWEPHKYPSAERQNARLGPLQAWVAAYYQRDDSWSYRWHRRLFDAHTGAKVELALPSGRAVRYAAA
jgi:adenylate kinase family enzyme